MASSSPPLRQRRILVVDDNVDSARTLAMLLRLMGQDARAAHDGRTALEECQQFEPEIVFLDLGMPGMSGYDVARELRASSIPQPLLVAMTGWGQDEDRRRTHEAGFDEHFVKPVEPDALRRLLA